jgi:hypothetical protein
VHKQGIASLCKRKNAPAYGGKKQTLTDILSYNSLATSMITQIKKKRDSG